MYIIQYLNQDSGEFTDESVEDLRQNGLTEFDEKFVDVDVSTAFTLTRAANFLDHKRLLHVLGKKIGNWIKGKTPAEIKTFFGLKTDFTEEDEERVRKENNWM